MEYPFYYQLQQTVHHLSIEAGADQITHSLIFENLATNSRVESGKEAVEIVSHGRQTSPKSAREAFTTKLRSIHLASIDMPTFPQTKSNTVPMQPPEMRTENHLHLRRDLRLRVCDLDS